MTQTHRNTYETEAGNKILIFKVDIVGKDILINVPETLQPVALRNAATTSLGLPVSAMTRATKFGLQQ